MKKLATHKHSEFFCSAIKTINGVGLTLTAKTEYEYLYLSRGSQEGVRQPDSREALSTLLETILQTQFSFPQQFYIFMLDLRDLIIDRIEQARRFGKEELSTSQHHNPLQSEFQTNRQKLKLFAKVKNKQKERILRQKQLFQEVKALRFWQKNVLQNFFTISIAIFAAYDSQYLSLLQNGEPVAAKMQELYQSFWGKEGKKIELIQLQKVVKGEVIQSTPYRILRQLCQWSRQELNSKLHAAMNGQFDRHEEEMKRISLIRSSLVSKEKIVNPLSFSVNAPKNEDVLPQKVAFTNKESVYGLFLDELIQYYKSFSFLELQTSFVKNMRKSHGKGNQFQRQDNLERAVQILIESKNKHTKQQIQKFRKEVLTKYPTNKRSFSQQQKRSPSPVKNEKKTRKIQSLKDPPKERLKSDIKEEQGQQKKKNIDRFSLLLSPKPTQISFQSSKQIVKQLRRQKLKRELELPELSSHKNTHSKMTVVKSRHISSFLNSANSAAKMQQKKKANLTPKCYDFKPKSFEKLFQKNSSSCPDETKNQSLFNNPQKLMKKTDGQQLRKNRKLMLQLLREKNRYAFLQK